jgi:hypothetical protein
LVTSLQLRAAARIGEGPKSEPCYARGEGIPHWTNDTSAERSADL